MNSTEFHASAFTDLVQRLKDNGVKARLPLPNEGADVYVAQLMGWVLDVVKRQPEHPVTDYNVLADDPLRLSNGYGHVTDQNGRSFALRGVVHPASLPPVGGE